jgi:hypothetical protein
MRLLRDSVVPALERMLASDGIADPLADEFWSLFDLFTRESLRYSPANQGSGFSSICDDGAPWEYCVSMGPGGSRDVRYLTEIGSLSSPLSARTSLSRIRIENAIEILGLPPSANTLVASVFGSLPKTGDRLDSLPAGVWVAVGCAAESGITLQVYANNEWGDELQRWTRLASMFAESKAIGLAVRLRELSPSLVPFFTPAGIGVTLKPKPLLKVYFRPRLSAWKVARELASALKPDCCDLIELLQQSIPVPLSALPDRALVFSIAADATAEKLFVKIDVNARHLFKSNRAAMAAIDLLATRIGVDSTKYHNTLALIDPAAENDSDLIHDFIGVGAGSEGLRLNVYLRDNTPPSTSRGRSACSMASRFSAIARRRAIMYLLDRQQPSGEWYDFTLPIVGISDVWATAYVGDALLAAAHFPKVRAAVHTSTDAAIRWLLTVSRPSGWGFNQRAQTDADSTALSLLLMSQSGFDAASYFDTLRDYAIEDGSFGTFRVSDYPNCWSDAHADVFPTVLRALRDFSPTALENVLKLRNSDGFWRSYWWTSDLYATVVALDYLAASSRISEIRPSEEWVLSQAMRTSGAFEKSLCLRALHYFEGNLHAQRKSADLISDLVASQQPDGSWPASAMLRVPGNSCAQPWHTPNHIPVYLDNGLFTTAAVCKALGSHWE